MARILDFDDYLLHEIYDHFSLHVLLHLTLVNRRLSKLAQDHIARHVDFALVSRSDALWQAIDTHPGFAEKVRRVSNGPLSRDMLDARSLKRLSSLTHLEVDVSEVELSHADIVELMFVGRVHTLHVRGTSEWPRISVGPVVQLPIYAAGSSTVERLTFTNLSIDDEAFRHLIHFLRKLKSLSCPLPLPTESSSSPDSTRKILQVLSPAMMQPFLSLFRPSLESINIKVGATASQVHDGSTLDLNHFQSLKTVVVSASCLFKLITTLDTPVLHTLGNILPTSIESLTVWSAQRSYSGRTANTNTEQIIYDRAVECILGLDFVPKRFWEAREIPPEKYAWILELTDFKRERLTSLRHVRLVEHITPLARKYARADEYVWVPQHLDRIEDPAGFTFEGIHFAIIVRTMMPRRACGFLKASGNSSAWNPGNWPGLG
ncbi:hypothetical protein EJ08DRAFT_662039 [Tothia fuscella]|uniref:F-box domain-containing protein n=1 Tax=Tothia fuscella TaxID=1048955 RepID=A0A9P4NP39_9PEZI|nr:hypothetical protein EJ08DRAFT_662039 [Tothia fuscella]